MVDLLIRGGEVARARDLPVYAETLHHYACFTADDYRMPRGFRYHTYPSLKYPEDQGARGDGLLGGAPELRRRPLC